jgi:hypothetical protein
MKQKKDLKMLLLNSEVGIIEEFKFWQHKSASRKGVVTIESFNVDSVDFSYEDAMLGRFNRFL